MLSAGVDDQEQKQLRRRDPRGRSGLHCWGTSTPTPQSWKAFRPLDGVDRMRWSWAAVEKRLP